MKEGELLILLPLPLLLVLTTDMYPCTQFGQPWGLNPGLRASLASFLPNDRHPLPGLFIPAE